MSTTSIEIIARGSFRAAQPNQVLIVAGDTITFTAPQGGSTVLSLSDMTAAILSPRPATDTVEIAGGSSVTFTFEEPGMGPYCCEVLADVASVHPIHCTPSSEDADVAVLTILSSDRDLTPPPPTSAGAS